MKLIKVLKTSNGYEVKTLLTYKFFGKQFFSREQTFVKSEEEEYWTVPGTGSKVSMEKQLRLEKWLKDHRKFIEKK
ncbi:hypothetical protein [Christiangramia sp. SM2212]|uniref:Uncharacterized protein n=1 Tax=Christiangramia sediminicola TaxID=3073267 RepID=A0ABU1EPP9_9FLAO|nr:hypothetical protein [Christiangramia sp. SM2212]MDR5590346.1 hypothetical protein [Christiangramia sp. SM2212]